MTRALLVVVLIAAQLPAAAARRRAVLHPSAPVQPRDRRPWSKVRRTVIDSTANPLAPRLRRSYSNAGYRGNVPHTLATGRAILSASYATMTTPARLSDDTIVPNGYALGVLVGTVLGHAAVWHDGAIFGFQSYLLYFPDQDIGVAVVTNAYPAPAAGHPAIIAMAVAEAALPVPLSSSLGRVAPAASLMSAGIEPKRCGSRSGSDS